MGKGKDEEHAPGWLHRIDVATAFGLTREQPLSIALTSPATR